MRMTKHWVLVVSIGIMALVALVMLSFGVRGSGVLDTALANPPDPLDTSGVTCADVYLIELQEPATNPKPGNIEIGDPVPATAVGDLPEPWAVSISLTATEHTDRANDDINSIGITYNAAIPGVIAGVIDGFPTPADIRCASVDKNVADVTGDTDLVLSITPKNGGPLPGMLVYWKDSGADSGFYHVAATDGTTTATLQATGATCNNVENATVVDKLYACIPVNKNFESSIMAHQTTDVTTGGLLDPLVKPRVRSAATLHGDFHKDGLGHVAENVGHSWTCSASKATQEGEEQNMWTRYEVSTLTLKDKSVQTPSYGIAQLFNPTTAKTCEDRADTKRSTNVYAVWSLDSTLEGDGGHPLSLVDPTTSAWDADYDKDKCLDWRELASPQPLHQTTGDGNWTGGRNPWNPYDCQRNLEGIWSVLATATDVRLDDNNNIVTGAFYRCRAHFQHDKATNDLTVPIFCYIDIPNVIVNPEDEPTLSGDGLTGSSFPIGTSPPPPPYADNDSEQTVLTGSYNKDTDSISLTGCFKDLDGAGSLGNVWIETVAPDHIDVLTGHGLVNIWILSNPGEPDCAATQVGDPTELSMQIGILAGKDPQTEATTAIDTYDYDQDGCPDKRELLDDEGLGGLRDPYNPWDFYDVDGNQTINLFGDIFGVAFAFGTGEAGRPNAHPDYDRILDRGGAMTGSNAWNQRAPDGKIDLFNDIFGVAFQFGHRCI